MPRRIGTETFYSTTAKRQALLAISVTVISPGQPEQKSLVGGRKCLSGSGRSERQVGPAFAVLDFLVPRGGVSILKERCLINILTESGGRL
jgi:hypothetical protein